MKSSGVLEEGFAAFTGESFKDVILQLVKQPAYIQTTVIELPGTYSTGSSPNTEKDIPSRYYGTIQVSAHWTTDNQFRISTSAPFYGRVRWVVSS